MANQKNQGGRQQQKQEKNPAQPQKREPMRSPEGGEDIERDRSSSRNRDDKGVESGVISNDEEVEVDVGAIDRCQSARYQRGKAGTDEVQSPPSMAAGV